MRTMQPRQPNALVDEAVGERLRRLRVERGLSQRSLAGPGISPAYISRIEAGDRVPSVRALRRLAAGLGVTAEYLETGRTVGEQEARELRLADAELKLRLERDLDAAEAEFRSVLAQAEGAGDVDVALRARVGLGEVAAQRGDFAAAVDLLDGPLYSLSPLAQPGAFATLARAHSGTGAPERAVALLERCLDEVRGADSEDPAAEIRFATYLSYALADAGELGRAAEIVEDALSRAEPVADPYTRVRLYWSLARLSLMDGKPRDALNHVRRAIGLLEATEDGVQLARAHLSCGEILLDAERAREAGPHLEVAERLLGPRADAADLGWLRSEQALHAARVGERERALSLARESLDVLGDADAEQRARAFRAIAEARLADDELDEAVGAYRSAVALLEAASRRREAIELMRELARALRRAGREREALDALERAAELALADDGTTRR